MHRHMSKSTGERLAEKGEDGFTIIEVLIALTILLIGMAGLLSMQVASMRATSFSRHASEASMLSEDKMEELRTVPVANLVAGNDLVDQRGVADPDGLFTRVWTPAASGTDTIVTVDVSWPEKGGEVFTITMSTVRN